jgi:hypothetical protein
VQQPSSAKSEGLEWQSADVTITDFLEGTGKMPTTKAKTNETKNLIRVCMVQVVARFKAI